MNLTQHRSRQYRELEKRSSLDRDLRSIVRLIRSGSLIVLGCSLREPRPVWSTPSKPSFNACTQRGKGRESWRDQFTLTMPLSSLSPNPGFPVIRVRIERPKEGGLDLIVARIVCCSMVMQPVLGLHRPEDWDRRHGAELEKHGSDLKVRQHFGDSELQGPGQIGGHGFLGSRCRLAQMRSPLSMHPRRAQNVLPPGISTS